MTVVYKLELTAELDDAWHDTADECVMSDVLMKKWEQKVANETANLLNNVDVVCTGIQVFAEGRKSPDTRTKQGRVDKYIDH